MQMEIEDIKEQKREKITSYLKSSKSLEQSFTLKSNKQVLYQNAKKKKELRIDSEMNQIK